MTHGGRKEKTSPPNKILEGRIAPKFFPAFKQMRPEPKGELAHVNPFTLVVAVALSAQATDVGVNRATKDLFKVADTPQKMLALGEEKGWRIYQRRSAFGETRQRT